mmetsp:Transcript_36191/g.94129  ORF Transcript_36191/g.94129 Transcript_36191/m.94129 type:complete len:515 (-) Transcript_36191:314-1858(-)
MGDLSDDEEIVRNRAGYNYNNKVARLQTIRMRTRLGKPIIIVGLTLLGLLAVLPGVFFFSHSSAQETQYQSEFEGGGRSKSKRVAHAPPEPIHLETAQPRAENVTSISVPKEVEMDPISKLAVKLGPTSRYATILSAKFPHWLSENVAPDGMAAKIQQLTTTRTDIVIPRFPLRKGEQLKGTVMHFVGTRFSLGQSARPYLLRMRLALFQAITVGSIKKQSRTNPFGWIVYADVDLPPMAKVVLEESIRPVPYAIVCYVGRENRQVTMLPEEIERCYSAKSLLPIRGVVRSADLLITTRLDSDDAIDRNVLGSIQAMAVKSEEGFLAVKASAEGLFWRSGKPEKLSRMGILESTEVGEGKPIIIGTTICAPPGLNATVYSLPDTKTIAEESLKLFNRLFLRGSEMDRKYVIPQVYLDTAKSCGLQKCVRSVSVPSSWLFSRGASTGSRVWSSDKGKRKLFPVASGTDFVESTIARFGVDKNGLEVICLLEEVDHPQLIRERGRSSGARPTLPSS